MNGFSPGRTGCEVIEPGAIAGIVAKASVEMSAFLLGFQHGLKCGQGVPHIANEPEIEPGAPPEVFRPQVDLRDGRFFRIKLLIRKIGSQHQEGIAVHDGVVAGRKAKQARHPNIIRIVVFDVLLAAQCVNDRRLQGFGVCINSE